MKQPDIGLTSSAKIRVTDGDLASALRFRPDDEFPAVFATSRLVALMEVAAARVLRPYLEEGELSVGVAVDIVHAAATPLGGVVTATARFAGQEGKLFAFEVSASDGTGE